MNSCCAGSTQNVEFLAKPLVSVMTPRVSAAAELEFVSVPAGSFFMGSNDPDANPLDSEGPVSEVEVHGFEISSTPVTNSQFAVFANATGYLTEAEKAGWSFVFHLLVPKTAEVLGISDFAYWWQGVAGANWRNPAGGAETYLDLNDHPAVHISYADALAYCEWGNFFLPSETQWEKAARGGLKSKRFPWGNELLVDNRWQCNIFQGQFPSENSAEDGFLGTSPVKSFSANGYGGYDFSGNVWEWTASNFSAAGIGSEENRAKVTRGGSYLCHDSYCNRYRVGARNQTPQDSIAGNIGFRVARGVS